MFGGVEFRILPYAETGLKRDEPGLKRGNEKKRRKQKERQTDFLRIFEDLVTYNSLIKGLGTWQLALVCLTDLEAKQLQPEPPSRKNPRGAAWESRPSAQGDEKTRHSKGRIEITSDFFLSSTEGLLFFSDMFLCFEHGIVALIAIGLGLTLGFHFLQNQGFSIVVRFISGCSCFWFSRSPVWPHQNQNVGKMREGRDS